MPRDTYEGKRIVFAGFGPTEGDHNSGAGIKRWAEGTIAHLTGEQMTIEGKDGANTCHGDSGGPVVLWKSNRWQVVGVLTNGSCLPGATSLAAMTTAHQAFIERHTVNLGHQTQP